MRPTTHTKKKDTDGQTDKKRDNGNSSLARCFTLISQASGNVVSPLCCVSVRGVGEPRVTAWYCGQEKEEDEGEREGRTEAKVGKSGDDDGDNGDGTGRVRRRRRRG